MLFRLGSRAAIVDQIAASKRSAGHPKRLAMRLFFWVKPTSKNRVGHVRQIWESIPCCVPVGHRFRDKLKPAKKCEHRQKSGKLNNKCYNKSLRFVYFARHRGALAAHRSVLSIFPGRDGIAICTVLNVLAQRCAQSIGSLATDVLQLPWASWSPSQLRSSFLTARCV